MRNIVLVGWGGGALLWLIDSTTAAMGSSLLGDWLIGLLVPRWVYNIPFNNNPGWTTSLAWNLLVQLVLVSTPGFWNSCLLLFSKQTVDVSRYRGLAVSVSWMFMFNWFVVQLSDFEINWFSGFAIRNLSYSSSAWHWCNFSTGQLQSGLWYDRVWALKFFLGSVGRFTFQQSWT